MSLGDAYCKSGRLEIPEAVLHHGLVGTLVALLYLISAEEVRAPEDTVKALFE